MGKTLKALTKGQMPRTLDDLDNLRAKLYSWKKIEKIKKKASPAVFHVFVGGELIEAWQDGEALEDWEEGGWSYIFEYYSDLIPYISDSLNALGLHDAKEAFNGIFALIPGIASFDAADLGDAVDFLKDPEYEGYNVSLQNYSAEERARISKAFQEMLSRLDRLVEREWEEDSPGEGWTGLLRYIERSYHSE